MKDTLYIFYIGIILFKPLLIREENGFTSGVQFIWLNNHITLTRG